MMPNVEEIDSQGLWKCYFCIKGVTIPKLFVIFAVSFLNAESPWDRWPTVSNELWVITGGRDIYIQRRFLNALGLTLWESRKFKLVVKNQSNGNAPWGVIIVPILMVGYDIYIGVGLSALLGTTTRAMREPSKRGPGTELAPRFSCVCWTWNK